MTTLRVRLLCFTVLALVATSTVFCGVTTVSQTSEDEMPKFNSRFVTLAEQTDGSRVLIASKKMFRVEASKHKSLLADTLKLLKVNKASNVPFVKQNVDYRLKETSSASIACNKLKWVTAGLDDCWDLKQEGIVVGYNAVEKEVYWETSAGVQKTVNFKSRLQEDMKGPASELPLDVLVTSHFETTFTVTFVAIRPHVSSHVAAYHIKYHSGQVAAARQEEELTILEQRKSVVREGVQIAAVCSLVYEPLTHPLKQRAFQIKLMMHDGTKATGTSFDMFSFWTGTPTLDLFIADGDNSNNPLFQLFFYRGGYDSVMEMQFRVATQEHCIRHYSFPPFDTKYWISHWMWQHKPAGGHPTLTHVFVSQDKLYLIPQNSLVAAGSNKADYAKYSVFEVLHTNPVQVQKTLTTPSEVTGKGNSC